jgi:hypothetical protein
MQAYQKRGEPGWGTRWGGTSYVIMRLQDHRIGLLALWRQAGGRGRGKVGIFLKDSFLSSLSISFVRNETLLERYRI